MYVSRIRLSQFAVGSVILWPHTENLVFIKQPNGDWRRTSDGVEYSPESFVNYDIEVMSELEFLSSALRLK